MTGIVAITSLRLGGLTAAVYFDWGSIFLVNLPIVVVALIAGRFVIPASKAPHRRRFDPPGILLGILASAGLTYTAIEAGSAGWTSAGTLARAA